MSKYNFVGYGSLINHRSLSHTIHNKKLTPVIIKGYRRVFDVLASRNSTYLNIEKSPGDYFNGVLFTIDKTELKLLIKRESPEYELKEVWAYDFTNKKKLCRAFLAIDYSISVAKGSSSMPNKEYFLLCREAAYSFGQEFGHIWDQTTFLADGKIISSWLKEHPDYKQE